MTSESQNYAILSWLRAGKTLTPLQALRQFGTLRLGARIYDLRQQGHKIRTDLLRVRTIRGAARVASYRLSKT